MPCFLVSRPYRFHRHIQTICPPPPGQKQQGFAVSFFPPVSRSFRTSSFFDTRTNAPSGEIEDILPEGHRYCLPTAGDRATTRRSLTFNFPSVHTAEGGAQTTRGAACLSVAFELVASYERLNCQPSILHDVRRTSFLAFVRLNKG